jgi:anionic cell wall polymer biosynthesis LytR-Cps2A-Psr (LCP) family protein
MRRTQEVVQAVMKKMTSPLGVLKLPALMSAYSDNVKSNITPGDLVVLSRLTLGFSADKIHHYSIGPNQVTNWTTADGASVLLPNTTAIQAILQSALNFE